MNVRLQDLLIERAVHGLAAEEQAELDRRLASVPEVEADTYDQAAAALHLAFLDEVQSMPEDLARRMACEAESFTRGMKRA